MSLLHTMLAHWPRQFMKPLAVLDSEIREELQFHIEMRLLDNMAAGMPLDEALHDAQHRFGDFEQSYQACRQATLRFRLFVDRLRTLLLILLGVTVVYLGGSLLKAEASYRSSLQALTQQMHAMRQAEDRVRNDNRMPVVPWDRTGTDPSQRGDATRGAEAISWSGRSLQEPWCDWRPLAESYPPQT